jgi:hypothetical protein
VLEAAGVGAYAPIALAMTALLGLAIAALRPGFLQTRRG